MISVVSTQPSRLSWLTRSSLQRLYWFNHSGEAGNIVGSIVSQSYLNIKITIAAAHDGVSSLKIANQFKGRFKFLVDFD